jgi:hypothetical protein
MSEPIHPKHRLGDVACLSFPFRMGTWGQGPLTSKRGEHVRDQIEQILFTSPGERVFRPEFGAGTRQLVFEPNGTPLWDVARRQLQAALAEALRGEVDPASLEVDVTGAGERMELVVRYRLTALGVVQQQHFPLGGARG